MIRVVETTADWDLFRELVVEYSEWLGVDLCFQGFADELARLTECYSPPQGIALLAGTDGCVGVHAFDEPGVCELKRMYVRESVRGTGAGRALAERAIAEARRLGFTIMRLDTLARLTPAIALYESLGFVEIDDYNGNPLETVRFFELAL